LINSTQVSSSSEQILYIFRLILRCLVTNYLLIIRRILAIEYLLKQVSKFPPAASLRSTPFRRALSEAEYINLEDQYQNVMQRYGMPANYYSRGEMGRQEGFEKFISGDVSPAELEDRISTAQKRVINANPEVTQALKTFYPSISNGDILAYTLDPSKAIEDIKRKVTAAEIGGAAVRAGLTTSAADAACTVFAHDSAGTVTRKLTPIASGRMVGKMVGRLTGAHISLKIAGKFLLTSLEFELLDAGSRMQPVVPDALPPDLVVVADIAVVVDGEYVLQTGGG